jgi:hypothetical protein
VQHLRTPAPGKGLRCLAARQVEEVTLSGTPGAAYKSVLIRALSGIGPPESPCPPLSGRWTVGRVPYLSKTVTLANGEQKILAGKGVRSGFSVSVWALRQAREQAIALALSDAIKELAAQCEQVVPDQPSSGGQSETLDAHRGRRTATTRALGITRELVRTGPRSRWEPRSKPPSPGRSSSSSANSRGPRT